MAERDPRDPKVSRLDEYRERRRRDPRHRLFGGAVRKTKEEPMPSPEEVGKPDPLGAVRKVIYIKQSERLQRAARFVPSWITPNGITVFRGLLIAPAVYLLLQQRFWAAFWVLALAFFLDFVDGWLAEARRQFSEFGKVADPIMDKILVCGTLIALAGGLHIGFQICTYLICSFAALITMTRVIKLAYPDIAARFPGVRAGLAGKLKMNFEVFGTLSLIVSRANGSHGWEITAFVLLIIATFLGAVSLMTQFVGPPGDPK